MAKPELHLQSKTGGFRAVLNSPLQSRSSFVDSSDTSPSSLVLNDLIRVVSYQFFSLPGAATAQFCAKSPRTVLSSGVQPNTYSPNTRLHTLVDGDAEDLTGRCCTEVRDVEVAVRAECHTGRNREPGGYIFDIAGAIKAYNLAIARSWEADSGR